MRINCAVLSDVSAAEFEARAKVDLSARTTRGGELEVLCDNLAAKIRWRERGRAWFARAMAPAATPATLVDALLVASKELVEEASKEQQETTEPIPPNAAELSDAAQNQPPSDRAREPSRTAQRADDRATLEGTLPSRDRSSGMPSATPEWAWGVSVGTQGALFDMRGTGMVGPSVGVFMQLPAGFVASLAGEYDVALGTGDIVSARMASAAAVMAVRFGPARAFEVGVGGLAGSVFVSSESPYQPASLSQAFWGASVRGRYALRWEGWRFAVGPDVRFYGLRPEVAVDRAVVWSVPAASVGLALEVSRDLYGWR